MTLNSGLQQKSVLTKRTQCRIIKMHHNFTQRAVMQRICFQVNPCFGSSYMIEIFFYLRNISSKLEGGYCIFIYPFHIT